MLINRIRQTPDEDGGFTLIELLVVIIIIGILAAIAVPIFLSQRQKGYDASAKSDLRNLANFEEIYLNDFGTYGDAASILAKEPLMEVSANDVMTIYYDGSTGYCLEADFTGAAHKWWYDSGAGGIQPAGQGCPVTVITNPAVLNGGTLG